MKTSKIAALALLLVAGVAVAQTVEERKAVMDAQIELLKKQKDLQEALRSVAGSAASGMPVVVSVTIGHERVARLQLPNGIVGHYREGESVRPGVVVASIGPKQVFVAVASSGKKPTAIPLEFAGPVLPGAGQPAQPNVPDALLPQAPSVTVPAIEVIPDPKPAAPAAAQPVTAKAGK